MSQKIVARLGFGKNVSGSSKPTVSDAELRCSFCDKAQADVGKLISNPSDRPFRAFICDECIRVCARVLQDDSQ